MSSKRASLKPVQKKNATLATVASSSTRGRLQIVVASLEASVGRVYWRGAARAKEIMNARLESWTNVGSPKPKSLPTKLK